MKSYKNIDTYIKGQPEDVQALIENVRTTIAKAAPKAEEGIKYGIPTFMINGKNLVHFGGFKKHIGFYPAPSGIKAFAKELSKYGGAKGSIQFPLDEKIPYSLITKIVKFRAKEIADKAKK